MRTSSETHENLATRPAAEKFAAAAPRWGAQQDRAPFPGLPEGWTAIGRCRFGTGGPGPQATGCHALAHPDVGVALIDIAPGATPNAEARLRRALTAAEFWPDFPGTLPVMHDRVDGTALRNLQHVLARGFGALPPLTVPGGAAWIEGVVRAMAADSAWEVPGHPKTTPDAQLVPGDGLEVAAAPPPKPSRAVRPRRWGRLAALPVAFAATFAVGVVAGFVLLDSPPPPSQPAAVAALPQPAAAPSPAPPSAETTPKTEEAAAGTKLPALAAASAAAPSLATETVAVLTPPPTPPPAPASWPVPPAAEAPPVASTEPAPVFQQTAEPTGTGASAFASPLETRVSLAPPAELTLPLAPPRAPAPPARAGSQQASRPSPFIDRACSQALFRFQQGERLTAAEQNFIRTGCSTTRR